MKKLFLLKNELNKKINLYMILFCLFSILLLVGRIIVTSSFFFLFLVWNLFLAWIPFLISIWVKNQEEVKYSTLKFIFICFLWLLFFPNAPYIITDFYHLSHIRLMPEWYDILLILSFSMSGIFLGLISLKIMQKEISQKYSEKAGWGFTIGSILLGSFGIYIGRFLRWNSWDIITNPFALIEDITQIMISPFKRMEALCLTFLLSIFLFILYLPIKDRKKIISF